MSSSKIFGLIAVIEWGMSDLELLTPYSFSAVGKYGRKSFMTHITEHKDFYVDIPEHTNDFLILFITNKHGDNCVIMSRKNTDPGPMHFKDISTRIINKFRLEYTK
jgi:hypothetical protein